MKKGLFECADIYAKQSTWRDFALVKFCVCAICVIIGMFLPQSAKKPVLIIALDVFAVTYFPLVIKFIRLIIKENKKA